MVRSVVTVTLWCALGLAVSGCMNSGDERLEFARELSYTEGRSIRSFSVEAPDPSRHTFDVSISVPMLTDVRVVIRTSDGYELHIVDSTKRTDDWCHAEEQRLSCFLRFPALEAPKPGRWTVIATKSSQPPADVSIKVTFTPLSSQRVAASTQWICPARFAPLPPGWIQGDTGANPASRTANSSAHAPGFFNLNDIPRNGVWVSTLLSPRSPTSPAPSRHRPFRLPLNLQHPDQIASQEGSSLPEYRFAGRYRGIYFVDVRVDFGRRQPTLSMRRRTQTLLRRLRLPPRLVSTPASCR